MKYYVQKTSDGCNRQDLLDIGSGEAGQDRFATPSPGEQRALDRAGIAMISADEQVTFEMHPLLGRMWGDVVGLGVSDGIGAQVSPCVDGAAPPRP